MSWQRPPVRCWAPLVHQHWQHMVALLTLHLLADYCPQED